VARKNRLPETARPAPFTPEQVGSLVAGQANNAEIGKLLTAHRQPRLASPAEGSPGKAGPAPIPLSAAEVRELATGSTPESIQSRLESAARTRRARATRRPTTGTKPTRRPG
jgi:hypothetical protein